MCPHTIVMRAAIHVASYYHVCVLILRVYTCHVCVLILRVYMYVSSYCVYVCMCPHTACMYVCVLILCVYMYVFSYCVYMCPHAACNIC